MATFNEKVETLGNKIDNNLKSAEALESKIAELEARVEKETLRNDELASCIMQNEMMLKKIEETLISMCKELGIIK